ncbi:hypothetical protein SAMN05421780_1226 [Flexibacter flexilis DSM 6793]|uniref:Uncharacterized protein n=1 Tax=Flexibacter flexilis DSM 6793 TaxID=927664 RepID=A0A1I1P2E1_9BACT|nr:hypothetical protein SAMN05421780_1226 [Flexibacter flexilis DSM 6793]
MVFECNTTIIKPLYIIGEYKENVYYNIYCEELCIRVGEVKKALFCELIEGLNPYP